MIGRLARAFDENDFDRVLILQNSLAPDPFAIANDAELACDGDYRRKDERYRRNGEYVRIMRLIWTAVEPVSHSGEWYRFDSAPSELLPVSGEMPVYGGGASPLVLELAGAVSLRRADRDPVSK